jgi:hypothetical protein
VSDNPVLVNEDGTDIFEPDYYNGLYYFGAKYIDLDQLRGVYHGTTLLPLEGAALAVYRMLERRLEYLSNELHDMRD